MTADGRAGVTGVGSVRERDWLFAAMRDLRRLSMTDSSPTPCVGGHTLF